MPNGIFLITHHEIRGPEVKLSYFENEMNLSQEFVSQLYMAHSGFSSTYDLEMKFEQSKVISYFTGNKDRRIYAEGILGIVFEIDENVEEISLFLQRNLDFIISNQNEETLKEILLLKLPRYLSLIRFFKKYKVQDIDEMLLLEGSDKFKKCILSFVAKQPTMAQLNELYEKMYYTRKMPSGYLYFSLDIGQNNNFYLVLKCKKNHTQIKEIFDVVVPFLEENINYALEILVLFFAPHLVTYQTKNLTSEGVLPKKISLLSKLRKRKPYRSAFENIVSRIVENEGFLIPI